ncbi:hypothetical protein, partial [Bacteroides heparinolyticus]|uniref:hypothetical protein n=1 Tax=Prevotella heparinolytica TaxID=28113 RepID=UPI0035A0E42C
QPLHHTIPPWIIGYCIPKREVTLFISITVKSYCRKNKRGNKKVQKKGNTKKEKSPHWMFSPQALLRNGS